MIGLLINPSAEVIYGYCAWLTPILFGLFIYIRPNNYPDLRLAIQKTLLQATGLLGLYGIYQYIAPPIWDVYWWQSLPFGLVAAFGRPVPYEVRVWSTMNAPQPFAAIIGMSLLLILGTRIKYKIPVGLIGLSVFSLTLVRTEWLGLIVGIAYLASRMKAALFLRSLGLGTLSLVLLVPLLMSFTSTRKLLEDRVESFTHLASDDSVSTRLAMYQHLTADLVQNPYGHGVGNKEVYLGYSLDSGPLKMLYNFGLLGTFLYLAGALCALWLLMRNPDRTDVFAMSCGAILLSAFAKFLSLSAFMNASGILVWLAIGMGLAARQWNVEQRRLTYAVSN
jgi:hypothetical protein